MQVIFDVLVHFHVNLHTQLMEELFPFCFCMCFLSLFRIGADEETDNSKVAMDFHHLATY